MSAPKATLLLVVDDTFTRTSMTAYLKAEGYEVLKAGNGVEAIELVRSKQPDLIITDLCPETGGLELLEKCNLEFPRLPTIIISGEGNLSNVIEALQQGAGDYLQKPIQEMGLLKHSIERLLSYARLKEAHDLYREDFERLVEKRTQEIADKNRELIEMVKEQNPTEAQLLQTRKLEAGGQVVAEIAREIKTRS